MKTYKVLTPYIKELEARLADQAGKTGIFDAIVNSPFQTTSKGIPLGLGVVVLLLVNEPTETIDRIALSDTEPARGAVEFSVKPFHEIKIPTHHESNLIARAIRSGKCQVASDWRYLFVPVLTAEEARFNQAGAGIATSVVYPIIDAHNRGALIFSYFIPEDQISEEHHRFMNLYSKLTAKYLKV